MVFCIQYLRGLAALLVVGYHMYIWESKAVASYAILPDLLKIGDAGVDLFFVISGFIMVFIQREALSVGFDHFRFIAKRFCRIFPPYWIASLALLPLWIVRPTLFNNYCSNQMDLVSSFLLLPQHFTPLLAVGWTLIHELYFYLIVSVALLFGIRGRVIFGLAWFAIVFCGYELMKNTSFHGSNLLKLVFSPFSLTFLLGYFMGLAHPVLKRLPWTVSLLFLAAGILGLVAGISVFSSVGVYPDNNSITRLVAFGLPCAAVVMGGLILEQAKRPKFKPLLLLGDASYSIYLVHLPVLAAFYAVIKKAEIRESGQLWIAAGLCLMSCLAAGLIFHLFIEKKAILVARLRFVCKDEEPRG